MCWGPACNSLKKLWKSYKIAGRNGEPRRDTAWKINAIQKAMGIQKSEFPELDGMEMDEELTEEEIQLKREEREDAGGLKNLKNLRRNGPRKISNCVERSGRLKRKTMIGGSVN